MLLFIVAFLLSFILCGICIRMSRHDNIKSWLADYDVNKVQSAHSKVVPRIGGLPILLSASMSVLLAIMLDRPNTGLIILVIVAALPVFGAGLLEDITKKVNPLWRLLSGAIAACLLVYLCDARIHNIHLPIDGVMVHQSAWVLPFVVSVVLTVVCVTGVIHSINIIDGLNGLASMVAAMMFTSMAYIAFQVGDFVVLGLCFTMLGAIAGFFIWNYPAGLLFLGDGGAYFLGLTLSAAALLLTARNPSVSSWYAALLFIYPVFETIFSMYRRKKNGNQALSQADALHLHSLIYNKVIDWVVGGDSKQALSSSQRNSLASPFLWVLSALAIIPATFFWKNSATLFGLVLLFCVSYTVFYKFVLDREY